MYTYIPLKYDCINAYFKCLLRVVVESQCNESGDCNYRCRRLLPFHERRPKGASEWNWHFFYSVLNDGNADISDMMQYVGLLVNFRGRIQ